MTKATIEQIIEAVGGKASRDGNSVVVSYGSNGYARLTPDYVIIAGGVEVPAADIQMAVRARKGGLASDLRAKLRAAGIEVA